MNETNEIEALLFKSQSDVNRLFVSMDASVEMINSLSGDDSIEALDVIARNKEFLNAALSYNAVINSGVDLSKYTF